MMWIGLSFLMVVALVGGLGLLAVEAFGTLRALYERGGEQHWDMLASRLGLLHGHDDRGGHVLDGQVGGVWLHVSAEDAWMLVRGRIEALLPPGTRIVHRSEVRREIHRAEARASGIRTGNPVLDGLVHVTGEGSSASEISALLQRPELAEALLAVIHAFPGSTVDSQYVVLRYPDTLGRHLEERCAAVVALVQALRRARQEVPIPQRVLTMDMLRPERAVQSPLAAVPSRPLPGT